MLRMYFLLASFIFALCTACAQQPGKIRLVVRGDDMGSSQAANEASIVSYQKGFMKTIEVMVPCAWFPQAADMLRENPGLDVGIHLVLTSEWETVKWRPLTYAPSLTDENGFFFPMIWPNKNYGEDRALKAKAWKLEEIEVEFRAQIEMGMRHIPQVSHLSCHMGCNDLDPAVNALVKKLAQEYKLDIDLKAMGISGVRFEGPKATPQEKIDSFIAMLEKLKPGTYLFVEHPAYDNAEMRNTYHIGYEDVARDREGVTQLFTSKVVMDKMKALGIEAISYADLKTAK